jgi:hypothetical protein
MSDNIIIKNPLIIFNKEGELYEGDFDLIGSNGEIITPEAKPEYDHDAPELHHSGIIPDGGTYTIKTSGEVLTAGASFPATSAKNDIYTYGDYKYTYEVKTTREGWKANAVDLTKENYNVILESINGKNIVSMQFCFKDCTNLKDCPVIPANVQNLSGAFRGCVQIAIPPEIPGTVTDMAQIFSGCTELAFAPNISHLENLMYFESAFRNCSSLFAWIIRYTGEGKYSFDSTMDFRHYLLPETIQLMSSSFYSCSNMVCAPTIPASVTDMTSTFYQCTNLSGVVICHASPTKYDMCFQGTKIESIVGDCVKTGMNGNLWATK